MHIFSLAYNFSDRFNFTKAKINFQGREFVFHHGGDKSVDCIETILQDKSEQEEFYQVANSFCLGIVANGNDSSFRFLGGSYIGLSQEVDLYDRPPFHQEQRKHQKLLHVGSVKKLVTEEQILLSSLLNEAIDAKNIFYEFICYWKILEIPINNKSRSAEKWINKVINDNPKSVLVLNEIKDWHRQGKDIGKYFKDVFRNAIVHIAHSPRLSPNNFDEYMSVVRATKHLDYFVEHFISTNIKWERYPISVDILKTKKTLSDKFNNYKEMRKYRIHGLTYNRIANKLRLIWRRTLTRIRSI